MPINSERPAWPGWETVRVIGRGSFGAVYEIERTVFGDKEKAALKVISIPQRDGEIDELRSDGYDDKSITERFTSYMQDIVREYSLMAKLKGCANIVYCDDLRYVQHDNGIGWDILIKMELLTALTKALPPVIREEEAIALGIDMCSALAFCEERQILHRDIKPQNIFVAPDGTYKLGDFGIAKTAERTTSGTKTGTYKYMAPEIYNNRPYGLRSDICSLGLVLYWMLNERRTPFLPLPPKMPTTQEEDQARSRRFSGEPIPPPLHGSEELKRIVLKACAYEPDDRYRTAAEMLADLRELTAGKAIDKNEPSADGAYTGEAPAPGDDQKTVILPPTAGRTAAETPETSVSVSRPPAAPVQPEEPAKENAEPGPKKKTEDRPPAKDKSREAAPKRKGGLVALIAVVLLAALAGAVLLFSEKHVEGIALSESEVSVMTDGTCRLTASVEPADARDTGVFWSSEDPSIAVVTEEGEILGVSAGKTVVTATTRDKGLSAACVVTVQDKISSATLSETAITIEPDGSYQLEVLTNPAGAKDVETVWASDAPSVAYVTEEGVVKARDAGTATITVTVEGRFISHCTVTVTKTVAAVSLNKDSLDLEPGAKFVLVAAIDPEDATDPSVTWSSSNESVAKVSSEGTVTAGKAGNATVTVTTNNGGKTAQCKVVVSKHVKGITLKNKNKQLYKGSKYNALSYTITPSDATNKKVTWESSNPSVVKVSEDGKLQAVGRGKATITVRTVDGGFTAKCTITVTVKQQSTQKKPSSGSSGGSSGSGGGSSGGSGGGSWSGEWGDW